MCYAPLFGDCYLRDEIARELLAEGNREPADRRGGVTDGDAGDERVADVDLLTGGAARN